MKKLLLIGFLAVIATACSDSGVQKLESKLLEVELALDSCIAKKDCKELIKDNPLSALMTDTTLTDAINSCQPGLNTITKCGQIMQRVATKQLGAIAFAF